MLLEYTSVTTAPLQYKYHTYLSWNQIYIPVKQEQLHDTRLNAIQQYRDTILLRPQHLDSR